jgi:hypothetical protein
MPAVLCRDVELSTIFRRIHSSERKWLVRLLLKTLSPIKIPDATTLRRFHFAIRHSVPGGERAIEAESFSLRGYNLNLIRIWPGTYRQRFLQGGKDPSPDPARIRFDSARSFVLNALVWTNRLIRDLQLQITVRATRSDENALISGHRSLPRKCTPAS